jgi:hypothetical protein
MICTDVVQVKRYYHYYNDKVKDNAIAHLSDELLALSTRLQEIERRQQLVQ